MSTDERVAALESILEATEAEDDMVKKAAVNALATTVAEPKKTADAVKTVLQKTQGQAPEVKRDAVAAVAGPAIPPPKEKDVIGLWWALIVGLLILLVITVVVLAVAILDGDNKTSADKVLIVFTPLLTGLLGLFAPSPRQTSGGSGG